MNGIKRVYFSSEPMTDDTIIREICQFNRGSERVNVMT